MRAALDTPGAPYFIYVNSALAFLVGFSLPLTLIAAVPALHHFESYFAWMHWPVTISFTIEYCARVFAAEKRIRYILSPIGIIDFVSVLPAYLGFENFGILKAARLARFARIIHITDLITVTRFMPDKPKG
jgi:voltage-gated potassium channel